jgi:TrmH family RNA methyltransferase
MLEEKKFVFVLVRPNFLGNIGSSARVLKNFGFDQLRLVSPPRNYLDAESRQMAVDAFDVLKKSKVFDSLPAALEDINMAVATSSGQYRRHVSQNLNHFLDELFPGNDKEPASRLSVENKIAIVFGDERNGLTNDEIDRCQKLMRIESSSRFPSLNLAQALGIVAYQLALRIDSPDNKERKDGEGKLLLLSGSEEDQLFEKIAQLMDQSEFSRTFSRKKVQAELRNTIKRLGLSQREGQLWLGFLTNIIARLPQSH